MKQKLLFLLITILSLNLFISCLTPGNVYDFNYPGDSEMQNKMEKEYGSSF